MSLPAHAYHWNQGRGKVGEWVTPLALLRSWRPTLTGEPDSPGTSPYILLTPQLTIGA